MWPAVARYGTRWPLIVTTCSVVTGSTSSGTAVFWALPEVAQAMSRPSVAGAVRALRSVMTSVARRGAKRPASWPALRRRSSRAALARRRESAHATRLQPGGRILARQGWQQIDIDGWEVLVGRSARENDELTFRIARPRDLWLHASGHA